ncbi:hypothetical protein [Robbsia andropogonis]|nr:hypothetical protein [Robbsia andropogonis]MCP1118708.1 hypothetical protein [Robbsia andropogonis]MCP1128175.1 hypothetical protein [Robbsia andropogonis]
MTPFDVIRMFERRFANDQAPLVDDAISDLATWIAENKDKLSLEDVQCLLNVGATLFEKGMDARMERPGPASRVTAELMEQLRTRR